MPSRAVLNDPESSPAPHLHRGPGLAEQGRRGFVECRRAAGGDITTAGKESCHTLKLRFAQTPVDCREPLLFHKTTRRGLYETALNGADDADEVVLWNEQGEVTECCTANLVIEKNGALLTPPVTCGLLPGTYREFLVRRGLIEEAVLSKDDLKKSSCIYLVNAVRKWRKAELLPD